MIKKVISSILSAMAFVLTVSGIYLFVKLREIQSGDFGAIVMLMLITFIGVILFVIGNVIFLFATTFGNGMIVRVLSGLMVAIDIGVAMLMAMISAKLFLKGNIGSGIFSLLFSIGLAIMAWKFLKKIREIPS